MKISVAVRAVLGVAVLSMPLLASAESSVTSGNGANMATSAHVDFQVTIPRVLFFRVGTGSTYFTGGAFSSASSLVTGGTTTTIDLINFTVPAASEGSGTAVAGTGGDAGPGVETAAVVSTGGNVNLTATTTGLLTDATADTIPWSQISVSSATLNSATALPAPAFTVVASGVGTGTAVNLTRGANGLIQQDAKWTYQFANSATYPGGTYGGAGPGTSRVTYTATMP
jgi:hypothetical protein